MSISGGEGGVDDPPCIKIGYSRSTGPKSEKGHPPFPPRLDCDWLVPPMY